MYPLEETEISLFLVPFHQILIDSLNAEQLTSVYGFSQTTE